MPGAIQPIDVAATITAVGSIAAVIVGIRATRPRQLGEEAHLPGYVDPNDTPAALRERIAALESRCRALEQRAADHDEELALLRALEVAVESERPPRRGARK
jgi:hypothetical protein